MILQLILDVLVDILDGAAYIVGEILYIPLVIFSLLAGLLIASPSMILISFFAMIVYRYNSYNN